MSEQKSAEKRVDIQGVEVCAWISKDLQALEGQKNETREN